MSRRSILLRGLAVLVTLVAFAAGAAAEVTIANIAPWSTYRPYAALGSLRGTELMVETINAAGGLLGQKLRDVQIDDGCDPEQAEAAAKLVVASHPVLVMGGGCSTAALHVAEILAAAGILQIVPNAPSQQMTEHGLATILRMTGRGDREGVFAAALVAKNWGSRRIAVCDDGEANWHEAAVGLIGGLRQRGVVPVLTTQFAPNQASYSALVQQLRDNRIDVVWLNGLPPDLGLIAHEVAAAGFSPQLVAGRNGGVGALWQTAGAAVEGLMFTERRDWHAIALADPVLAAEKARGGDVNVFLANAYAAMKAWSESVAAAGTFDGPKVAAALKGKTFSTVIGDLAFDANGDLTAETEAWVWYRWHDGQVQTVE